MAIDKMIPRFLVSDTDERLLKEGAMTDALNITISEDGVGSEGVLKNIDNTTVGTAVSGHALTASDAVTVIGQVSDSQRGFVYFFVADNSANSGNSYAGTEHAIYQYDTTANTYKIVFKNTWFKFNPSGFVKADVVNAAFQQDGVTQTVLYFTDNLNEPRKINVDRALAGDYTGLSLDDLDYALNSIKAPQTNPVDFNFETDTTIPLNNFSKSVFQFATQYIYKDGEESAISPYSKLAHSAVISAENLEEDTGVLFFTDNRCDIDMKWVNGSASAEDNPADVKKIRLLGRRGNNGSFFVIDEFDPREDLSRDVHLDSVKVYDKLTAVYKFYNTGVYPSVPTNTVNKLYDNIPQLAVGQALVGNRLIYSNYTEGYPNNPSRVNWRREYGNEELGGAVLLDGSEDIWEEVSLDFSTGPPLANNYELSFQFTDAAIFPNANEVIPTGSLFSLGFQFNPIFGLCGPNPDTALWEVSVVADDGNTYYFEVGNEAYAGNEVGINQGNSGWGYNAKIGAGISQTLGTFTSRTFDFLKNELEDTEFHDTLSIPMVDPEDMLNFRCTTSGGSAWAVGDVLSEGAAYSVVGDLKITYSFIVETDTTTGIKIRPYIKSLKPEGAINLTAISGSVSIDSNITLSEKSWSGPTTGGGAPYYLLKANSHLTTPNIQLSKVQKHSFVTKTAKRSFKAGCSHDFGVVYYDKHGRSGNVNKIGGFYSEHPGERTSSSDMGAVGAKVDFYDDAPDWAHSWQLVYGGMRSYDSFVTYTTGKAYVAKVRDAAGTYQAGKDTNRKQIFVSLRGLDQYVEQKNTLRGYSFTEGDKLRVIKYKGDGTNWVYPLANDSKTIIEFNVVGVEILGATNNPLQPTATDLEYQGTFLVLEAPQVASGADNLAASPVDIQYPYFDWFSLSDTDYPNSDPSPNASHWGKNCCIEILTPKKTEQTLYYEVGQRTVIKSVYKKAVTTSYQQGHPDYDLSTNPTPATSWSSHGPTTEVNCADTYITATPCKGPVYSSSWTTNQPHLYGYTAIELETQSLSDYFVSQDWDKGRAHVHYEPSATVNRYNGLTYSDAYAEDVANLSLSSFNPSLANFDSLDSRYGKLNYIGGYNDDLLAIQENKFALVPVGKNIIEYAGGSSNVAISTNVLGQRRYSSGDFGCGDNPEAVLIQDNDVFFVDASRQKVMRFAGGQLTPISDKYMSSYFDSFFTNSHTKYVSGYDPRINTYFLTGLGGTAETIGYDVDRGFWQSRYSFTPDIYANQNNMMYSALYNTNANIFYRHESSSVIQHNKFYEESSTADSSVTVISKIAPSRVKTFNAISYEGSSGDWAMSAVTTDLGQSSGTLSHSNASVTTPQFNKLEGAYFSEMPRDTSSYSQSHLIHLGKIQSVVDGVVGTKIVTTDARINRFSIPKGAALGTRATGSPLAENTSAAVTSLSDTFLSVTGVNTFTITSAGSEHITASGNLNLYAVLTSSEEGDPIRGHWAKITLTNSSLVAHEIYCINAHITDSKTHHALGQQ